MWLLRAKIEAGPLAQSGVLDRELVILAWFAVLVTQIAQAKTRIRKSLLAELCLELITQVNSRPDVSPAPFVVPLAAS